VTTLTLTLPAVTRFDVEPILFGTEYHRAETADAADYWTVYSRDAEGLAQAQADVRTLTDALTWVSIVTPDPVEVDVNPGSAAPGWDSITIAPVETRTPGTDLAALLFDVTAAEHAAGVCDGLDTYVMTENPTTCPRCGRRTVELASRESDGVQHHHCEPCRYSFHMAQDFDGEEQCDECRQFAPLDVLAEHGGRCATCPPATD
jgi:hypothetical protein